MKTPNDKRVHCWFCKTLLPINADLSEARCSICGTSFGDPEHFSSEENVEAQYFLKINERLKIADDITIIRIPSGFLYVIINIDLGIETVTFVPWDGS